MVGHEVMVRTRVRRGEPANIEWRGKFGKAVDVIDDTDEVQVQFGEQSRWFYAEQLLVAAPRTSDTGGGT